MMAQANTGMALPRPAVQGIASGIFFMAAFGAYWGYLSASFMSGAFWGVAFVVIALVTVVLFMVAGRLLRYARTLPEEVSPEDRATGKRIGLWFGIVFGIEIVLIVFVGILLARVQLSRFIAPVIALIVGIHFLPLARLFHVSTYYVTGVLLSALALIAIVALLLGLSLAGPSPYNWSLFVSVGVTLVLWLTGFWVSRFGLRVMRHEG